MKKNILFSLALLLTVATAEAAFIFTMREAVPNGANGNGTRVLSTSEGSVSAPVGLPVMTYTISNLDLTSVGGSLNETIVFDVTYTSTGGDPRFSNWGNVAVTGGTTADRINPGQTLTSTVSLNNATTFDGQISLGFIRLQVGGLGDPNSYTVGHDGGTITSPSWSGAGSRTHLFPVSSFITLAPVSGNNEFQSFDVEITAIPEPSTLVLLGIAFLGALVFARRRH